MQDYIESKSGEHWLYYWVLHVKIFLRWNLKIDGSQWCLHSHKYVSWDFTAKYGRFVWGSSFTEIYLMHLQNWKHKENILRVGNIKHELWRINIDLLKNGIIPISDSPKISAMWMRRSTMGWWWWMINMNYDDEWQHGVNWDDDV